MHNQMGIISLAEFGYNLRTIRAAIEKVIGEV